MQSLLLSIRASVRAAQGSHAEAQRRKGLREGGVAWRGYLGDWEQCVGLGDLREVGVADSWVMAGVDFAFALGSPGSRSLAFRRRTRRARLAAQERPDWPGWVYSAWLVSYEGRGWHSPDFHNRRAGYVRCDYFEMRGRFL